jgi:ABC-type multidrug transport system ATPase subunit
MLSGDIFPTDGSALVGGHDILKEQLAVRRLMGYCPQFDALFGLLTAREHLQFYGRIKGVPEDKMDRIVKGMLHYLSLEEYADRPAGTYSGGNKRKLSVAIALIGDPPVVFLDEPSTGMDPVARRFMWRFISDTMEGRSVILTTHSMEECEALCHRIGIMVGGRLRCLGSAQHLKSKFGSGYQLDVNGAAQKGDHVYAGIMEIFPDARLLERHDAVMKFQLPGAQAGIYLADVFEKMEAHRVDLCVVEYSVSQTSLEQIFIHFAKQQDEEKGVASGFQNVQGLAVEMEMTTEPKILRSPLSKYAEENNTFQK